MRANLALRLAALLWAPAVVVYPQNSSVGAPDLHNGREIYRAACIGCHGPDGKGMPDTTVGFRKPETFPDFTRCDQTTPELDVDWKATIRDGGPGRGFSPIMPAFGESLSSAQMDAVIAYMRGFCRESAWPRGELNLPRALITEKAYPEDEAVVTSSINAQGNPGLDNALIYEHRFGARNQVELTLPFSFARGATPSWFGGIGDFGVGVKRVLIANHRTGSIFSVTGEVILPTGNKARGFGTGVTVFETFAAYGQILPRDTFIQLQAGTEQPTHTEDTPRAVYWRATAGKSFRQGGSLGRLWSPMVEWLADRDLVTGARTNWDVLPQFQVTLSKRQHVRADVGVRIPFTNTAGRSVQVVFYLLWDWFDGGIAEGWR